MLLSQKRDSARRCPAGGVVAKRQTDYELNSELYVCPVWFASCGSLKLLLEIEENKMVHPNNLGSFAHLESNVLCDVLNNYYGPIYSPLCYVYINHSSTIIKAMAEDCRRRRGTSLVREGWIIYMRRGQ